MKKCLILLAVLLCAACQSKPGDSQASATPAAARPKLVALGDSLTEGLGVEPQEAYPAQLQARLQEAGIEWEVVNAGLSGETSSGALSRLEWVMRTEPDAVFLATGANDGLRGIDPEITASNLDAIVTKLKTDGVKVMLAGMKAPPNLGGDYTEKFEAIYPEVAQKQDVPLIPFLLDGVATLPELNQEDGKHPTAEGYTKVVELIFEEVKDWLQQTSG